MTDLPIYSTSVSRKVAFKTLGTCYIRSQAGLSVWCRWHYLDTPQFSDVSALRINPNVLLYFAVIFSFSK